MSNRLAAETSPYLLQHAENPVDWHPWGEDALALARRLERPILLSIGYSACHWCHVMAHESFEDPLTAGLMNRLFVNVKVDREERPDLDQVYQTAHQMLTGRSGGWPLTLFLTPAGEPFLGGTYFPPAPRYGLPAFSDLLQRVDEAWRTRRADIERQNRALLEALNRRPSRSATSASLPHGPVAEAAVTELAATFDAQFGGFGSAPKFAHPMELGLCLRRYAEACDDRALAMATQTLTRMTEGGLWDQLGGGFFRYSTDDHWGIPHFEKMLYDNALLLGVYTDAWLITRDPLYERVVAESAGWVMRDMQADTGGYFSSLDADSDGGEGRYYLWSREDIQALLPDDEFAVVRRRYGLDQPPNFEGSAWHLRVTDSLGAVAKALGIGPAACAERLTRARAALLAAREQRRSPARDDKVLAAWNGLMIRAMARAARAFGREDWLRSAQAAADFVRGTLWHNGRLLATCRDGRAHLNAYLDDYAFLMDGLLALLQAAFRNADLGFATDLAEVLLGQFEDLEGGGFWFTSHDHERLIQRVKSAHDGALPAGNGVAAHALQCLGHLAGEQRYLNAAERALHAFAAPLAAQPAAHASLIAALEAHREPTRIVVVRGPEASLQPWREALAGHYRPGTLAVLVPTGVHGLPAVLDKPAGEAVNAWVCSGVSCSAPVKEIEELMRVCAAPVFD